MMRFNKRVRESLAVELKRLAWSGTAAFGLLGWSAKSGWILVCLGLWFLLVQVVAHAVLAVEDTDTS